MYQHFEKYAIYGLNRPQFYLKKLATPHPIQPAWKILFICVLVLITLLVISNHTFNFTLFELRK